MLCLSPNSIQNGWFVNLGEMASKFDHIKVQKAIDKAFSYLVSCTAKQRENNRFQYYHSNSPKTEIFYDVGDV